ncbi:hypothetical protein HH214_05235 [Mucilaginibacter robiniae]|uniref:Uncharacterized protein n=1 Tax=Mucilaginibacter robiniae TaxID=2728022 RepID=A0A7L5E4R4_9SPHI|nr:hypothetical protein [Mucilaginibacter robiniae]QJD95316.1 hypothetical protein HH214_05235 [Mucilaginibacter robiniae]
MNNRLEKVALKKVSMNLQPFNTLSPFTKQMLSAIVIVFAVIFLAHKGFEFGQWLASR